MTTVRLVQLSRMYGVALETDAAAAARISQEPETLGRALFDEAVASDDVTGTDSALSYLDDRLADFDGLIASDALPVLRAAFESGLRSWADD